MIGAELFHKTVTLATALLTGESVSPERMRRRIEICRECDMVRIQGNAETGLMKCGVCKCRLKTDHSLVNLARYEEVDGKGGWGCKHAGGSKWKAAGV